MAETEKPSGSGVMPDSFEEALEEADRLTDLIDPEETPYVSKYAARELLNAWRKRVQDGKVEPSEEFAAAQIAFRLGRIGLDTEEPHEAELELNAAAKAFFPGLEAAVKERMGALSAESVSCPGPQASIKAPPVALSTALLKAVKAGQAADVAEEALEVLNLLGILWSGREDPSRSLLYLLAAQDVYGVLDPLLPPEHKPGDETAAIDANNGSSSQASVTHGVFRRELDSHYTHTLFYLAQVYGLLEKADLSAHYCQQTLKRQLELEVTLDTLGWVKNCLSLVDYFTKLKKDTQAACHCLCACTALLKDRTPSGADPEQLTMLKGEIARRWAWLYMSILQAASEAQVERQAAVELAGRPADELVEGEEAAKVDRRESGEESSLPPPPPSATTPAAVPAQQVRPASSAMERFTALSFDEPRMPEPESVDTYEKAREVFLKANKSLEEAKKVFVFEGFVTDHVNLNRDISRIYRSLAVFEEDEKRKQAMYQRRAAALQAMIDEINPRAYEALHKQLAFELGEVYMEMMDMKFARMDGKIEEDPTYRPKKAEAEKVHELRQQAVRSFEHFCDMYQIDDEANPGHKVWQFDKDELRPILRANFHLARLYGRSHPLGSMKDKVDAVQKSLKHFEWLKAFAKANIRKHLGTDSDLFEEELEVCEDMISMLPEKINQMHYRGRNFDSR